MNERLETIKFLVENIISKLLDFGFSNEFLNLTQKTKATKEKNRQVGLQPTKGFCTAKEIINKIKMQPIEWEIIFAATNIW